MNKRNCYTLIELLVVICIMLIIFGISLPAFNKITKAQAVPSAVRELSAKMHLLRGYAIEQRKTVALAIYRGGGGERVDWYRPAILAKTAGHYDFKSWIEEAAYLSMTVKFAKQTREKKSDAPADSFSGYWKNSAHPLEFVSSPGNTYEWFIYSHTGQLTASSSAARIAIRQVSRPDNDYRKEDNDTPNALFQDGEVSINQFTGRLSFNEQ
ncbi:MAG: hypothetical protein A2X49_08675 [Lentisphaerae bacterium GWF2_52_8]|nr:MAG: hypothetical protein A2X49_08675 [Lentisphaerae bacterium GWF2_52_8]